MPFTKLSNHIKETIDQVDGFETGNLIVDLVAGTVQLEQAVNGRCVYRNLSIHDEIEVRNRNEYFEVTTVDALNTIDELMQCSLYAGVYARVKFSNSKRSV